VVDDDPEILEITCRILENSGYATASARNGQEAISYIESGATLDVVLADITMPMLDGIALSRFVRTTRPETRIITMSGKYRPSAAAPSLAGVPHLVKPFSTDQLLESMSTILNSGSTHA
jgi:CheY-like chemotaxis protein